MRAAILTMTTLMLMLIRHPRSERRREPGRQDGNHQVSSQPARAASEQSACGASTSSCVHPEAPGDLSVAALG